MCGSYSSSKSNGYGSASGALTASSGSSGISGSSSTPALASCADKLRSIFAKTPTPVAPVTNVTPRPTALFEYTAAIRGKIAGATVVVDDLTLGQLSESAVDNASDEQLCVIAQAKAPGSIATILGQLTEIEIDSVDSPSEPVNAKAVDAWDEQYADTHNEDGTPQ